MEIYISNYAMNKVLTLLIFRTKPNKIATKIT